jgi:hypothetical protein
MDFAKGTCHRLVLKNGTVVNGVVDNVDREKIFINDASDGTPRVKEVRRQDIDIASPVLIQGRGFLGDSPSPSVPVGSGSSGASSGTATTSASTQWHGYGCKCGKCGGFGTYAYGEPVY